MTVEDIQEKMYAQFEAEILTFEEITHAGSPRKRNKPYQDSNTSLKK